jgi:hypothetical protein
MRDAIPRAVAFMRLAGRCSPGEFDRALAISPAAGRRLRARMRAAGLLAGNKATIYLTDAHDLPAPTRHARPETAPVAPRLAKPAQATEPPKPTAAPRQPPARVKPAEALLDGATAQARNEHDEHDDTTASAPRHRPLLDTLAQLVGGSPLEPAGLHQQAALNAAATRRARSRGEPAALPLNVRVEQAPRPAAPSPGALIPGYYPGPPPWVPDQYGRPRWRGGPR